MKFYRERSYALRSMGRFGVCVAAASTCSTVAHAQTAASVENAPADSPSQPPAKPRKFPRIGPDVGYQYFLDSKTRERFGSAVLNYGLGGGGIGAGFNGNLGIDFSILRANQTNGGVRDQAFLIILGPEYRRAYIPAKTLKAIKAQMPQASQNGATETANQMPPELLQRIADSPALPYYGASLNAIYGSIDAPSALIDDSGFGVGGSLFAGVSFKRRAFIEARLRVTNSIQSYNFSSAGVSVGVRF